MSKTIFLKDAFSLCKIIFLQFHCETTCMFQKDIHIKSLIIFRYSKTAWIHSIVSGLSKPEVEYDDPYYTMYFPSFWSILFRNAELKELAVYTVSKKCRQQPLWPTDRQINSDHFKSTYGLNLNVFQSILAKRSFPSNCQCLICIIPGATFPDSHFHCYHINHAKEKLWRSWKTSVAFEKLPSSSKIALDSVL